LWSRLTLWGGAVSHCVKGERRKGVREIGRVVPGGKGGGWGGIVCGALCY